MKGEDFVTQGRRLVSEVSKCIGLDLFEKTRKRPYVLAKQSLMAKFRDFFVDVTLEDIGKIFDKDHSTVIHGINSFRNYYKKDGYWDCYMTDIYDNYEYLFEAMKENQVIGSETISGMKNQLEKNRLMMDMIENKFTTTMSFFVKYHSSFIEMKSKYEKEKKQSDSLRVEVDNWKNRYLGIKSKYESIGLTKDEEFEISRINKYDLSGVPR
jgi:hypothetical protein